MTADDLYRMHKTLDRAVETLTHGAPSVNEYQRALDGIVTEIRSLSKELHDRYLAAVRKEGSGE